MKNTTQIQEDIKTKMDELHSKIENIRDRMDKEDHPSEALRNTINDLEDLYTKLKNKYNRVKNNPDTDWDEMDKNMYQDFTSLNRSFEKAGTLFRGK